MFGIRYNQVNIKRRITIALALIAVMMCTTDVQLYCEQRILAHAVTCTIKLNQQGDYFNMSISELMNVAVVSQSDVRNSSFLLNFPCYYRDKAQQPA